MKRITSESESYVKGGSSSEEYSIHDSKRKYEERDKKINAREAREAKVKAEAEAKA